MPEQPIILCELYARVDVKHGFSCGRKRYRVKLSSGGNYVRFSRDHDDVDYNYAEDFCGPLKQRVAASQLLKLSESYFNDSSTCIRREIWYLDQSEEEALASLRQGISNAVQLNLNNAQEMMRIWTERKSDKPKKKE
jgi:hypothetical protein